MAQLSTLDPATLSAFQSYLGMPVDGAWSPELASRIGAYQGLLGQTQGQTDSPDQWSALVSQLQQRGAAFGQNALDPVPAQDPAYQLFMRNAGAQESEILDEIRYRTEQSNREINRRAAGFAADKQDVQDNTNAAKTQGTAKIGADYADRGFGAAASARDQEVGTLVGNADRSAQQQIGGIDQNQLESTAGNRDNLAEATRRLGADANSLYRKKADEELAARNRVLQGQLEQRYGQG